jgi:DNA-directed RNA polymerase specialized sigma24 family protein
LTASHVETLVRRVLAHEPGAWQELWRTVEPRLLALLRRPRFLGRLSASEDDCRNIVVEIFQALEADDHARLRHFCAAVERNAGLPFLAWLTVVAKRLGIDYMRRHPEYRDLRGGARAASGGPKGAWIDVAMLPTENELPANRPPYTDNATAHELAAFAENELPPDQRAALAAWTEGRGFDEIARTLGCPGARDAERLVRAALERIRRRFPKVDAP